MNKIEQFSRLINHNSTVSGQKFTIPTSNDHTDNTWLATDLYIGEIGINVSDDTAYMRTNNGIIQLGTTSSVGVGSSSSNIWIYNSPDIAIGSSYSISSIIRGLSSYTDLGRSSVRWKDLYLGGSANERTLIDINGGLSLTEKLANGILSSGYDTNDNSPIQIFGSSSNVNKSRPIHINSLNSILKSGNQKVSIGSNNIIDNSLSDSTVIGQYVTINTGVTSSVHLGQGYNKTNYSSNMVTVGNLSIRGIADDGSGQYMKSDWTTNQSKLRTSNALTTNLVTIPWIDDGVAIQVKAYIIGVSIQDASLVYSSEIMGTFFGGASIPAGEVATQISNNISSWTGDQPDSFMICDSGGVYIKVIGRPGDIVQWLVTYSYQKMINLIP